MKILIHSYFLPLVDHQAGGAQMFLSQLLRGLSQKGIELEIICPRTNQIDTLVNLPGAIVHPVLYEEGIKPLEIHQRYSNLQQMASVLTKCDYVLTIDRPFPISTNKPIVLLLQTIAYANVIDALLRTQWDALVVPSNYLATLISPLMQPSHWQGNHLPEITVIPNAIDTVFFRRANPCSFLEHIALPYSDFYLLFPHRPEKAKGFQLALKLIRELVISGKEYKLLIPTHPHSNIASRAYEASYTTHIKQEVSRLQLEDYVIFHEWINLKHLPAYFSLGYTCLNFSLLPEGFGFVPFQSISCGTPVITTKAGAISEHFPPNHGVNYIAFDDLAGAINALENIPSREDLLRGREYIDKNYNIEKQVQQYIDLFTNVSKTQAVYQPLAQTLRLSPWCQRSGKKLWHDFRMRTYHLSPKEIRILDTIEQEETSNLDSDNDTTIKRLIDRGIILYI